MSFALHLGPVILYFVRPWFSILIGYYHREKNKVVDLYHLVAEVLIFFSCLVVIFFFFRLEYYVNNVSMKFSQTVFSVWPWREASCWKMRSKTLSWRIIDQLMFYEMLLNWFVLASLVNGLLERKFPFMRWCFCE